MDNAVFHKRQDIRHAIQGKQVPELPEIETSRRGIEPYLVGYTILHTVVRNPRLRWPVADEIMSLRDQKVVSVQRRAKYLLIEVHTGWLIIHLGMSGSLRILEKDSIVQKHDHIDVMISSGKILRYRDPRRFGAWLWSHDLQKTCVLTHLGHEPLEDAFNGQYLFEKSRAKRIQIKPWLMDAKVVVGIGNIYASESLFVAGIMPDRPSHSLTATETEKLSGAIKAVLSDAIALGGTTLRDFLQTDGKPGYFAQQLHVYGRAGSPCRRCGGLIESLKHGQRSTFFCSRCQH